MRDKLTVPIVQFHFLHKAQNLTQRNRLKAFLVTLFKKEKTLLSSLNYIFCSDKYLLDINNQFLQHNYYTDIITFNLATGSAGVEGEVYISLDRVRENATVLNEYFNRELHRVIFHGALHLCGYGDKSAEEIKLMRQKEEVYLDLYFA